jgi:uncharacterized protein (DUF488 family)
MTPAQSFDLLTIGHSNVPAAHFDALLHAAGVTAIADVRSVPFSRRSPWFSAKTLAQRLHSGGITYLPYGEALGGRPKDATLYCDGVADYEAMASTAEFREGLARVTDDARHHRVCLLCAEREPLDCHRCLLVGRALAKRGSLVGHILPDGRIEPHAETEERLLSMTDKDATGDLFADRTNRLTEAYRRRARAVGARAKA